MNPEKKPIPIIIPLHHGGGKLGDDTELRFALRSIEQHFKHPYQIVIVGRKLPDWLVGVEHLQCEKGLKTALRVAADAYPKGFMWWYDDCTLLQDISLDQAVMTPAMKNWCSARTAWAKKLEEIRQRLVKEKIKVWDYSRPHGPYSFDKGMIDEAFADWPGMAGKFPFETWILCKRDWPRRFGGVKQYYGPFRNPPGDGAVYLNYNDAGNTQELRAWLADRFPNPSRFERSVDKSLKVAVHTIRFGSAWWVRFCGVTLDSWARKHGHSLRVWKEDDIPKDYPCAKFCEVDMLKEFLSSDADLLFYVDADVYVSDDADALPLVDTNCGFLIRPDRPSKFSAKWPSWVFSKFGRACHAEVRDWAYCNAGVWICDRESAGILLSVIETPYYEAVQEQHHWNWWLCLAKKKGMRVSSLPAAWNAWPAEREKANFHHLCGVKKLAKVQGLRSAGLIPPHVAPMYEFSPAFDFEAYRFAYDDGRMPMDEYHIHLLHEACKIDVGVHALDKVAVEIGSYHGASTSALVEALNQGLIGHLHVVEIRPNEFLRRVLAMASDSSKVTLHTCPFWEVSIDRVHLVFIDGDHKWPAVGDAMRALTLGAEIICMHDSQSYPSIPGTWGAKLAAGMLKDCKDRHWFEDCESRNGWMTHRGFFVSALRSASLNPLLEFECRKVFESC
jgi:hypothetical protein